MICSEAEVGGWGLKLDDGLRKSTECLATISPDSTIAPPSLDRASSQPNLVALISEDPVSSTDHRSNSPGKSAGRRRPANDRGIVDRSAKLGKDDVQREVAVSDQRTRNEDQQTEKLAVIDRTLAKVMYGLKTLDDIEQNSDTAETKDDEARKSPAAVSETIPIVVKTSTSRDDRQDEGSSFASFSRGKKAATLPKTGGDESSTKDLNSQVMHADSSHLDSSAEGQRQSANSGLSRSDSASQRKEGSGAATSFPSNVGHSRFEVSSRAIPAATPVVPSGAPAVPPKPSTAKKPAAYGRSVKMSKPSNDGKTGGADGKLAKK